MIPAGWIETSWGEISALAYGKALSGYRDSTSGVRVFGTNGPIGFTNAAPLCDGPGVVVGRKGAYRGIHFSDAPFYVIDTAFWLKPTVPMLARWAYYALLTQDINGLDSGSAIPSTTRDAFYSLTALLPPIEEQRGIAATLGALDDKIESNRRAIVGTHELLDAMSLKLAESVRNSVPLSSLCVERRASVNPMALNTPFVDHFSLPAFDAGAVAERVPPIGIKSNKLRVEHDSILISRLNPRINRTWWCVPAEGVPAVCSTEFLPLGAKDEADLGLLWLVLRDEYFRSEMASRVTGTSGSHQRVRPADLLSVEVPDFSDCSQSLREQSLMLLKSVHQKRTEICQLEALRDVLLPELLSGRIRVPEAQESIA